MAQNQKKVIIGLSIALFLTLVVCGLMRWHMHQGGDRQWAGYRVTIAKDSAGILDLDGFVVLLAENEDQACLSLSISVKVSSSNVYREMEKKKTFLRGVIYRVLDKAAKAGSPHIISKEQLKRDIIDELNGSLVTGTVNAIYFTKFLVI